MPSPTLAHKHQRWLLELTRVPTAAGRERRVIEWVRRWVAARRNVTLTADAAGNLVLTRKGSGARRRKGPSGGGAPIYFTAHMDHPAFVLRRVLGEREVHAEFLGGVHESYFAGSPVLLYAADDGRGDRGPRGQRGRVVEFLARERAESWGAADGEKHVRIAFDRPVRGKPGDVLTWDTGEQRIKGDRLFTPACDDLAGVAAALAAFDVLLSRRGPDRTDVRVLLTRAEEVGFVGAIAACKARTIPRGARVIALENSKTFAESPIGGGPIVRVGDFTSTFDPDLTYRVGRVAQALSGPPAPAAGKAAKIGARAKPQAARGASPPVFKWQRKLMPGGTCEASAYQSFGYAATCLCLPLGNYHNMNEATKKIDAETISLGDFHGLVRLLVAVGQTLDDPEKAPPLRERLEDLFKRRRGVLEE